MFLVCILYKHDSTLCDRKRENRLLIYEERNKKKRIQLLVELLRRHEGKFKAFALPLDILRRCLDVKEKRWKFNLC